MNNEELINAFLDYLKYEKKLSNNTYLSYKYNLDKFLLFLNKKSILNLSTNDIRDFLYQDGISAKTRAHYLTVINSLYNYIIENGYLKDNPTETIKLPKIEKKLPEYLTVEEVDKLLNVNPTKPIDYRNVAMLEIIYGCGLRVSELVELKLSNIDFDECVVRVMGKGSKERIVP